MQAYDLLVISLPSRTATPRLPISISRSLRVATMCNTMLEALLSLCLVGGISLVVKF
jgi:hypothetical protein